MLLSYTKGLQWLKLIPSAFNTPSLLSHPTFFSNNSGENSQDSPYTLSPSSQLSLVTLGIFVISSVGIDRGTRIERICSPCLGGRPAPGLRLRGNPAFVFSIAESLIPISFLFIPHN